MDSNQTLSRKSGKGVMVQDAVVSLKSTNEKAEALNLTNLHSDGKDFMGGRAVEPFVTVQSGDLRKETKSAKKSTIPSWNDTT